MPLPPSRTSSAAIASRAQKQQQQEGVEVQREGGVGAERRAVAAEGEGEGQREGQDHQDDQGFRVERHRVVEDRRVEIEGGPLRLQAPGDQPLRQGAPVLLVQMRRQASR